ncbi:MAG: helix-turn-helix domain-containing protein [Flavobacteriaceae bacterium]|jgi:DNA-binding Lrp family transcriptional regulator|nr:helix-turn-helix domain-containing protein [Flavobacteriaceae bacterium]
MNYTELTHQFWEFNAKNPMNTASIAMYFFLLELWRKNNENDFQLPDAEICERLNITRPTVISLRRELLNRGLIQYEFRHGFAGCYKIVTEFSDVSASIEIKKFVKKATKKRKKQNIEFPPKIAVPDLFPKDVDNVLLTDEKDNKVRFSEKIPSKEEFLEYAKTLEIYDKSLDSLLEEKYKTWKENHWQNGYGRRISNWKSSLKNTLPYLNNTVSDYKLPKIVRPRVSGDE